MPRFTAEETRNILRFAAKAMRSQGARPPYPINKTVPYTVFGPIAFTFWVDDEGEFVAAPPGRRSSIHPSLLN